MALRYETIAVPVANGIDVNTPARLVDAGSLLEAKNSRLSGGGSRKRRGHAGRRVRGAKAIPAGRALPSFVPPGGWDPYFTGDRGIPSDWLFGWGPIVGSGDWTPGNDPLLLARDSASVALETSLHPDAGLLFGAVQRDDETLAWNGHQLFSRTSNPDPNAPLPVFDAVLPALRARGIAKVAKAQTKPDCARTSKITAVAWLDGAAVKYSVLDAATGAVIVPATSLPSFTDPKQVRCVALGGWVHFLVHENSGSTLQRRSIQENTPSSVVSASLGACSTYFDAWKVSESSWIEVRNTGTGYAVTWRAADASAGVSFTPDITITGGYNSRTSVAISVHDVTGDVGLVWRADGTTLGKNVFARSYAADGTVSSAVVTCGTVTDLARPVACSAKWLADHDGKSIFNAYWDDAGPVVKIARFSQLQTSPQFSATRRGVVLASQAFRAGDRTFVWAGFPSTTQAAWVLLDEALLPVGHLDYPAANVTAYAASPAPPLASVGHYGAAPAKDTLVHHCALGYRVRVSTDDPTVLGVNKATVYSEPSVRFVELDFLPPLRAVRAGGATYFAGAQVWSYDGTEMVDAGFLVAPEVATPTPSNGGALTALGTYTWRVDLCYRNAQNEEVRSHSFYTNPLTLAGAQQQATLTIPTCITRRADSYFLVFRNASTGTQWYLTSSRDPTSALFVKNDLSVASVTFVDDGTNTPTDAGLLTRELHPGNGSINYVQPQAAPACEILAAGHGRLWIAGGEVPTGEVHPSRLFGTDEAPTFNPILAIRVDRTEEPITAIGFVGEQRAYFRDTAIYAHDGDGPDNELGGAWADPRLTQHAGGAISQDGLATFDGGLVYQSPAGFRLLGAAAGASAPIGTPVDNVAKDFRVSAVVVVPDDEEIRWYRRDGDALVYNYRYGSWSTWTVRAAGAGFDATARLGVLASPDGYFLSETDGLYTDNGSTYAHRVRFPWLRAGNLIDFQAVRRVAAVGEADPADQHTVRCEFFYDEREFPDEVLEHGFPADVSAAAAVHASLDTAPMFVPLTGGLFWDAILECRFPGAQGNRLSLFLTIDITKPDVVTVRDNQFWNGTTWFPSDNVVGVLIGVNGVIDMVVELEDAINTQSSLVRVRTPSTHPGSDAAGTGSFPDYEFSGGADDGGSSWNTDTFGSGSFGDGTFGDDGSGAGDARDAVWRWRRRPQRRKCSVFSVAIDDSGAPNAGFALNGIALEVGRKPGLDRSAWRGGASTTAAGQVTVTTGR